MTGHGRLINLHDQMEPQKTWVGKCFVFLAGNWLRKMLIGHY